MTSRRKLDETRCGAYRAVLGRLLYVAPDRPDVQHTVSLLARGMSSPSERQYPQLRYGVEYLYSTRDYCLVLHWTIPGKSFWGETALTERGAACNEQPRSLEAVSHADWAGVHDRHSISCGQLYMDGNLMFSYSRRQATTALSSCESTLMSATGTIAEALYLKCIMESLTQ